MYRPMWEPKFPPLPGFEPGTLAPRGAVWYCPAALKKPEVALGIYLSSTGSNVHSQVGIGTACAVIWGILTFPTNRLHFSSTNPILSSFTLCYSLHSYLRLVDCRFLQLSLVSDRVMEELSTSKKPWTQLGTMTPARNAWNYGNSLNGLHKFLSYLWDLWMQVNFRPRKQPWTHLRTLTRRKSDCSSKWKEVATILTLRETIFCTAPTTCNIVLCK